MSASLSSSPGPKIRLAQVDQQSEKKAGKRILGPPLLQLISPIGVVEHGLVDGFDEVLARPVSTVDVGPSGHRHEAVASLKEVDQSAERSVA